jgi:hypothetical protein
MLSYPLTEPQACHAGGSLYSSNGHCYKLQSTTQNWQTAEQACVSLGSTAHLAKIDSAALQTFILSNVVTSGQVWTGLTDRNLEGQLEWADGEIWSSYPAVTAAVTDCFHLDSAGTWQSSSCTATKNSVCEYSSRGKEL